MAGGPITALTRAILDGAPDSGPLLDTVVFQPRDDAFDRWANPNHFVHIDLGSAPGSWSLALSFRPANTILPRGGADDCGGGVTTSPAFSCSLHASEIADA